jgi:hypothetical protein
VTRQHGIFHNEICATVRALVLGGQWLGRTSCATEGSGTVSMLEASMRPRAFLRRQSVRFSARAERHLGPPGIMGSTLCRMPGYAECVMNPPSRLLEPPSAMRHNRSPARRAISRSGGRYLRPLTESGAVLAKARSSLLHARLMPKMKQTQARCGPKHGPCRRFGGAVRADEPPPPQTATRLGKAARQQTAASHVPPAWSRSPPALDSALGGHAPRAHDSSRLARPPRGWAPAGGTRVADLPAWRPLVPLAEAQMSRARDPSRLAHPSGGELPPLHHHRHRQWYGIEQDAEPTHAKPTPMRLTPKPTTTNGRVW